MDISGWKAVFGCACFGGALGELVKWYQLRESDNFPQYARKVIYWAITAMMILAGGGLALLYGTERKSALLVMNIGLSAPLIIKVFAESKVSRGTSAPRAPGYGMNRSQESRGESSIWEFLSGR
jgi:hypothetical protein